MADFSNFKLGQLTGALYTGGIKSPPVNEVQTTPTEQSSLLTGNYSGINKNIKHGDYIYCQEQAGRNISGFSRWIA